MRRSALAAVVVLAAAAYGAAPEPSPAPLKSGLTETVEVRLVTIDVTVLDRDDRGVPGLGREAFELALNGKPVDVVAVDDLCAPPQRPVRAESPSSPSPTPSPPSPGPRIVLALDYPHLLLPHHRDRGAYVAAIVHRLETEFAASGDPAAEVMVAALAGGLRTEQPFTRDAAVLVAALHRMRDDPALFGGQFGHLTERRFFEDLNALMASLARDRGPKAVVLFSAGNEPDTVLYDTEFKDLAARAGDARAAIYTVDSEGIKPIEVNSHRDPVGGPPGLARLAADTGGRMTRNANDLEIGYRRAASDLACRYTVSFRERGQIPENPQWVSVRVRRDGARALYPAWVR